MNFITRLLGGKKEKEIQIDPILPQEIYDAGVLELKDIIAPSALK